MVAGSRTLSAFQIIPCPRADRKHPSASVVDDVNDDVVSDTISRPAHKALLRKARPLPGFVQTVSFPCRARCALRSPARPR